MAKKVVRPAVIDPVANRNFKFAHHILDNLPEDPDPENPYKLVTTKLLLDVAHAKEMTRSPDRNKQKVIAAAWSLMDLARKYYELQ